MQTIVQDGYGPPDVLELRDIASPAIGDDEVLVRVHAAGVDRGVCALAPEGTAVIVGAETDGKWFGASIRSVRAMVLSRFIRQTFVAFVNSENAEDLIAITELIEAGKVMPTVDRAFPLIEASKAISYLVDGHARGKVVVTIDDTNDGGTG
jgi:NADPH:quinone reductase-like Zn-dependent oxidoreductase